MVLLVGFIVAHDATERTVDLGPLLHVVEHHSLAEEEIHVRMWLTGWLPVYHHEVLLWQLAVPDCTLIDGQSQQLSGGPLNAVDRVVLVHLLVHKTIVVGTRLRHVDRPPEAVPVA